MAIALLQSICPVTQVVPNPSVAFANPVRPGSLLIACVYVRDTGTLTVSDTKNNTWQYPGNPKPGTFADNTRYCGLAYAVDAQAGATTVSASSSGASNLDLAIHEFQGLDRTYPIVDVEYTFASATGPSTATIPKLMRTPNALIFAANVTKSVNGTGGSGDGYTVAQDRDAFDGNKTKYLIASTAGDTFATFSLSPADSTWLVIAAFSEPYVNVNTPVRSNLVLA